MNFAQVCSVVACAVTAFTGCGNDREAVGNDGSSGMSDVLGEHGRAAPPGSLLASDARVATVSSTPVEVQLVGDPAAAKSGALVVSGIGRAAHGQVTVLGSRAIYTPTPGFAGSDSFRYTLTDSAGRVASASVMVNVAAVSPFCTLSISGPSSVVRGTPEHLTANPSCNFGTPEIQWQHRTGTSGTFTTFKDFSADTFADFATASSALGRHQFRGRVRIRGTTTTFTSNTLTVTILANTSPCTTVALDAPTAGAIFATAAAIGLHATASCPAGVTPEFQYLVKLPTDNNFTVIPGVFSGGTSYTPAIAGSWVFAAMARAAGATDPFQLQSGAVTVSVSHVPTAVDDTLTVDEDTSGTVNVLANDSDPDGDALSATIVTPPVGGSASISGGVVTYRPAANYNGSDAIGYRISDGHGNTATATVHVTITPEEDPPSAHHDFITTAENTAVSFDPTANDDDADGDSLTVIDHSYPAHGTVEFVGNIATYTPARNFVGDDTFEYTIDDGHGEVSVAGVFVTVTDGGNDAPVAIDDQLTTPEDTEGGVNLLANDSDPDGDTLTVVSFTQAVHGTVAVVAGIASYIPAANYNGPDAFAYTLQDPTGATSTATVHITVVPVNDAPVAAGDSASLDEDTSVTVDVVANDSDIDGDALTVTAVSQPAHGTAAIVSGHEVSYTPAADFNGSDSFTYTITDAGGATATATVTLTIAPVNDAPVAVADAITVPENGSATVDVVANDSDVDGDALAITAISQPTHGSAAIVDATHVSYTPDPHYNGPDAFSYTISDGNGGEAGAAISVTVTAVNDPPVAVDDSATLDEDSAATIDVVANDSDLDGDALTVTAVTQPAHGSAAIADAHHVTYTPAANYNGADAFSYTISDGNGGAASANVAVTVNPVNDAPVAAGDAASVLEDGAVTIDVVANDSDVDGDALTIVAVTQPAAGAVAIADAHHVIYTPAANFHGGDAFSYTIADPSGAQATAPVAVTVISVNDAPVASNDAASLDEDTAVTVDVVANDFDVDGDALAIVGIVQPAHGLARQIDDHHIQYIPAPNYNGADAVGYTISDGNGGTASAQLVLGIAPVNDAPVAVGDAATLDEDTSAAIDVVANDSDIDGDTLSVASATQPAHGTAAITGLHQVTYTPAANYNGADAFSYTIDDGHGGQASATVTLTINPVNDAPVAVDDAATLDEDTSATIDVAANDRDVDGDALAVTAVTPPAHGTVAIVDATHVRYTPDGNFNGGDAFGYTIDDGHGAQASATVRLTVNPVNDPPVAGSGALATFDDTPAVATLTATDADRDSLAFAIATSPAHGSLGAVNGNRVTYTPAAGFAGSDSFTFVASDGKATSAPATINVTVTRSVCGNGVREGVHEECDDGNTIAGDGCEASCRLTCGSGTGADRATVDLASGHCFAAYDGVQHSYQEAAAMCTAFGGHLASITTAAEDAAAFSAVRSGDTPWLGATDIATEGTFRWVTGEAFGYSNFDAGKPDNAGNADCVRYVADGAWTDAACGGSAAHASGTLCEVDLAVTTPAFATGGGGTRSVAIADLNGDGLADIAAVNPANNTVGVLIGDGAGGFALQATVPSGGAGPVAVAAGDFDNDGQVDLAVVNATASTVAILRGTPTGFVAGGTVSIAAGATSIAATDVDGDGALDLAVGGSGAVQILRGSGNGSFTVQTTGISLTGVVASIAVGDFNRDGRIDLALTTPLAILVVMGTGGGNFGLPLSLALSINNRGIVAADLDGDGNVDLAVANGAATVSVFFGSASGGFGAAVNLTVAGTPQLVAAGDFDGDGATDLAALTGNFATLFHGAGRTFTPSGLPIVTGGSGAAFAAAARLNADGATDLVVANATSSTVGVLLGGSGGLAGARALPVGSGATATVSADFNEDGRADLAVIDPIAAKVFIFLQSSTGALVAGGTISLSANAGSTYMLAADFDGDGHLDLAVVNVNFSSIGVALGAGNGTFGAPQNTSVARKPGKPAIADFNGDGKPDLAVPAATDNAVTILINAGGGRFGRVTDLAVTGTPVAAAAGDFTGDGKKDIVVASSGEANVKLIAGHGDTTFSAPISFPVSAAGQAIATADLDGDGKLDVIVTGSSAVSVLKGTGQSFAAAVDFAVGSQPAALAAVDLDGDGRLDLVVGNAGSSDVTVLHNDGAGGFGASSFGVGAPPTWVGVSDLDKDGHLDIAVASGNGFVTLLYSGR
jgi:large repetitive protein